MLATCHPAVVGFSQRPGQFLAVAERVGAVTAFAVAAKAASVNVIRPVAAITAARLLNPVGGWCVVAGLTGQPLVFAIKLEPGLAVMVEAPERPVVGGVTAAALGAQRGFMGVLIFVAADAGQGGVFEGLAWVALITAGHGMLADQRETAEVMVKAHTGAEGGFVVTLFAAVTQLAGVNVFATVTTDAGLLQRLAQLTCVATFTAGVCVFSFEGEIGFVVMVELDALPVVCGMAVGTGFAIAAAVSVIILMAADAGIGGSFVIGRFRVALLAAEVFMRAGEVKVGRFVMVKAALIPALSTVAVFALVAPCPGMGVVDQMAADTMLGHGLILIIRVAAAAVNLLMFTLKGKVGFVVVEGGVRPAFRAVAVIAAVPQVALMRVGLFMAVDTLLAGVAVFLVRLVAAAAGYGAMFALQHKVGLPVVKTAGIELDNIGVTTLMVGVAGFTTDGVSISEPPVIALLLTDIGGDFLMAVQAQRALSSFAERGVALIAIGFILRVPLDQLTGHQQRFENIRPGRACSAQRQE